MAGLLGDGWDSAQSQGLLALASGMIQGNFGKGVSDMNQTMSGAQDREMKRKHAQMLMASEQRKMDQEDAQIQEAGRIRGLLASVGQPSLGMGRTNQVNDALPADLRIGAQSDMRSAGGIDYQGLIRQGVPIEQVKALAESRNYGREKVARTAEIEGPNGSKLVQGYDDYGQPVGQGANGYVAPVSVNQGFQTSFVKPSAGLSLPMGMSPSDLSAESNRNSTLELQRDRLEFDKNGGVAGTKPAKQGPMSVPLQKELLESDDVAQSSKAIIETLTNAKKINSTAYSGYAAKGRAVLASNMPWDSAGADATINLDNMMTGQALESLKSVFGGMPTEGERKILLDMQASAEKTPAQREAIMDRAIEAAKRRGEYANQKAQSIRGGTYLTEGIAQPDQAAPKARTASPADIAATARASGKTIEQVKAAMRAKGYEVN